MSNHRPPRSCPSDLSHFACPAPFALLLSHTLLLTASKIEKRPPATPHPPCPPTATASLSTLPYYRPPPALHRNAHARCHNRPKCRRAFRAHGTGARVTEISRERAPEQLFFCRGTFEGASFDSREGAARPPAGANLRSIELPSMLAAPPQDHHLPPAF